MLKFLPLWLRDNFLIKFGLFLLAGILWFLVVSERLYEQILSVDIELVNLEAGKVVANSIPEQARVKFQASGKELLRMQFINSPVLQFDMQLVEDVRKFRVLSEMIVMPGGIDAIPLEIVDPESLTVRLDDRVQATLPVVPRVSVDTEPGYVVVGKPQTTPDSITISGPGGTVGQLNELKTVEVMLEGVNRRQTLILELDKPAGPGMEYSTEHVEVVVKVERLVERRLVGVPLEILHKPTTREVVIEPGSVDLSINGPVSVVAGLTGEDITASVDYRSYYPIRSNRVPVSIQTDLPVEISRISPEDVRMIVRRK